MAGYTLLLSKNWDITLDHSGKIAMTSGAYGIAQGVANAVRLFTGDAYFGQTNGIPHFSTDLGRPVSSSVIRTRYRRAAENVDGVQTAEVTLNDIQGRTLTGDIEITTDAGEIVNIEL